MRAINFAFVAAALATGIAAHADTPPFTGRFLGTGRACYGTLAVRTRTLSWLTSFSQCRSVPYVLTERDERDGHLRLTFRLDRAPASCRYTILSMTHDGALGKDMGWEVTGYSTEASYDADRASGFTAKNDGAMMSCYLVSDPGKSPRANASR